MNPYNLRRNTSIRPLKTLQIPGEDMPLATGRTSSKRLANRTTRAPRRLAEAWDVEDLGLKRLGLMGLGLYKLLKAPICLLQVSRYSLSAVNP